MADINEALKHQHEFERLPSELMASVLEFPIDDLDVLLWMVLFHTHLLRFRSPMAGVAALAGWTQRVAAAAVADSWPDRSNVRANYAYWYEEYVRKTPYQTFDAVPRDRRARVLQLRERLLRDPRVAEVVPDDS